MTDHLPVACAVEGQRALYGRQEIRFDLGTDLAMQVEGDLGPQGLSPLMRDLVDLGAAVYQIERHLRFRQLTNPPTRFFLSIHLRQPQAWTAGARELLQRILGLLGNAEWLVEVGGEGDQPDTHPAVATGDGGHRVVLFSGGLDSACGAALLNQDPASVHLVSFYTRQKALQKSIARRLGFEPPAQWRMTWRLDIGRGKTFRYRSFLFLCLAAAVADSWAGRRVLQYENGVLATSVPPAPSWLMTRHAHPMLQRLMSQLLTAIAGGTWMIENPFLMLTKRQCMEKASAVVGPVEMATIAGVTETCWFHWSNRVVGGRKTPGVPCGVCIPCIVRRTAVPDDLYVWDLRTNKVRNDRRLGVAFRSYCAFLREVQKARSVGSFYNVLPAPGRELLATGALTLQDLWTLFNAFGAEFMETFDL